jgi:hypothetical protein
MIKIKIKNTDNQILICKPYDYNQNLGETYEKDIPIPVTGNKFVPPNFKNDIKIFLKMTPKISVERPPVIISKKRRVIEVHQIKSLRTFKKRDIWNYPSITGYIDTKDLLTPTLARNDFKNDKNFRLVKKAILEAETEIQEKFKNALKNSTSSNFSEIESKFNTHFKSLIEISEEDKEQLKPGEFVRVSDTGAKLENVLIPYKSGPFVSNYKALPKGKKSKRKSKGDATDESENVTINMEQTREFIIPPRGNQRNLLLKIDDNSAPIKDNDGKEKRSELFGNIVTIYKQHPDFVKRINTIQYGVELITTELITYIASEMLVHFTNYSFEQPGKDKQSDRKEILIFFTDWLYRLEDSLKNLIGKPLSK